jgi:hypothetical protein
MEIKKMKKTKVMITMNEEQMKILESNYIIYIKQNKRITFNTYVIEMSVLGCSEYLKNQEE